MCRWLSCAGARIASAVVFSLAAKRAAAPAGWLDHSGAGGLGCGAYPSAGLALCWLKSIAHSAEGARFAAAPEAGVAGWRGCIAIMMAAGRSESPTLGAWCSGDVCRCTSSILIMLRRTIVPGCEQWPRQPGCRLARLQAAAARHVAWLSDYGQVPRLMHCLEGGRV